MEKLGNVHVYQSKLALTQLLQGHGRKDDGAYLACVYIAFYQLVFVLLV